MHHRLIHSSQLSLVLSCMAVCLFVWGCENPTTELEAVPETRIETKPNISPPVSEFLKTFGQAEQSLDGVGDPLNCPVMLVAHSNFRTRDSKQYLSFTIQENPDYDLQSGDACQGDIKNLWSDLNRFDAQIEAQMLNINGIHDVDRALKYFPVTERAFKLFIDDAAHEAELHDRLEAIDRSTLEGGMEVDHTIIWFIIKNEQDYFAREHTPIIEATLSKYSLKMRPYETEKMGYCYYPYDICRAPNYDEPKAGQTDFKLERLSPGFSWYQFELPD